VRNKVGDPHLSGIVKPVKDELSQRHCVTCFFQKKKTPLYSSIKHISVIYHGNPNPHAMDSTQTLFFVAVALLNISLIILFCYCAKRTSITTNIYSQTFQSQHLNLIPSTRSPHDTWSQLWIQ